MLRSHQAEESSRDSVAAFIDSAIFRVWAPGSYAKTLASSVNGKPT